MFRRHVVGVGAVLAVSFLVLAVAVHGSTIANADASSKGDVSVRALGDVTAPQILDAWRVGHSGSSRVTSAVADDSYLYFGASGSPSGPATLLKIERVSMSVVRSVSLPNVYVRSLVMSNGWLVATTAVDSGSSAGSTFRLDPATLSVQSQSVGTGLLASCGERIFRGPFPLQELSPESLSISAQGGISGGTNGFNLVCDDTYVYFTQMFPARLYRALQSDLSQVNEVLLYDAAENSEEAWTVNVDGDMIYVGASGTQGYTLYYVDGATFSIKSAVSLRSSPMTSVDLWAAQTLVAGPFMYFGDMSGRVTRLHLGSQLLSAPSHRLDGSVGDVNSLLHVDGEILASKYVTDHEEVFRIANASTAPLAVMVAQEAGEATVSWVAPDFDGGAPILSYEVRSNRDGFTCTSTENFCTVSGLQKGVRYSFTVAATNAAGRSPVSDPSDFVTYTTAPGVVSKLKGTGIKGGITARWNAPKDSGGLLIQRYEYRLRKGDWQTTSGRSLRLSSLKAGVTVALEVRAVNAAGPGVSSRVQVVPK